MSRGLGTGTLTGLFGLNGPAAKSDDRLLDLYWNRAQLKKEYTSLRKDRYQLLDALTEAEGKAARLAQKIEYLEDLLGDPETASSTVVHYRLRKIWRRGNRRLLDFSSRLREQYERRESEALRKRWNDDIQAKQKSLAKRHADQTKRLKALQHEAEYLTDRINELGGAFQFFKRRVVKLDLATVAANMAQIINDIGELDKRRNHLTVAEMPEFAQLSLESRRAVNLTVLTLAIRLADHYSAHGIIEMAKAAREKTVGTTIYGNSGDCEVILRRIDNLTDLFDQIEQDASFVADLKRHAHELQRVASFNKKSDAIPTPGSMNGQTINVLADDMWSVSHAMMT